MDFIATQNATPLEPEAQAIEVLGYEDRSPASLAASFQPSTVMPSVESQDINFPVIGGPQSMAIPVGAAQPGAGPLAAMTDLQVPPLPLVELQTVSMIMGPGPQTMGGLAEITPSPASFLPTVVPLVESQDTDSSVVGWPESIAIPVGAAQPGAGTLAGLTDLRVPPLPPVVELQTIMGLGPQTMGGPAELTPLGPTAAEVQVTPPQTMETSAVAAPQPQEDAMGNEAEATVLQTDPPIPVSPEPQATKTPPESPPQYQAEESQAEGAVKVGTTRTTNQTARVSFKTPKISGEPLKPNHRVEGSSESVPISEFRSFISNVPWQDEFFLGAGINAFTGQAENRAVVKFDLPPSGTKHSQETLGVIRYETNLIQELAAGVGAGLTLNIGPIGLGVDASSSILSRARVSATSSSILATYTTTYDSDFDPAHQLTPEAAELARTDPERFRRSYGDYFITGGQRKSTFTALLVYSCSNLETLQKFTTQVSTNVSELFKLVGSGEWMNNAKQAEVDFKTFVEMRGYGGKAPTAVDLDPSKLLEALNWFKTNEVGVWSTARLQHYSTLDPQISRVIPIPGEIFKDIQRLHSLLQCITVLSASCPPTVDAQGADLVRESTEFRTEVETNRSSLAQHPAIRSRYLVEADKLYENLTSIHRRYMFLVKVLNELPSQPQFRHINAASSQKVWSYGISVYPGDPSIEIFSTRKTLALSASPFKKTETLSYSGNRLIVGWKVESLQESHHGSWRRLTSDILLSTAARVVFRSERLYPSKWELVIYHVDQALFNFNVEGRPKLGAGIDERTEDAHSILRAIKERE